jgi:hypothetical protein
MTYGYEVEPLADTAARLGATVPNAVLEIVDDYARALPIEAAQVVYTGKESVRVYWVSGSSLVVIETGAEQPTGDGQVVLPATGAVRSLAERVHAEIQAQAVAEPGGYSRTVYRTVKLHFENAAPIELPDPLSLPLDNENKRQQVQALLDAVLNAIDAR